MSEETAEYRTRRDADREISYLVSPEESARFGMVCLKKAVLGILEQPAHRKTGLQLADISTSLGIQGLTGTGCGLDYAVVHGILWELDREGQVRKVGKVWKLENSLQI